jgi:glycine/D-amino acid oxidase-like deaminating enzyme
MFFARINKGVLLGSDESRVSDDEANKNQPSRFITKYVLSRMRQYFSIREIRITNEWSGTMGMTPDEYPVIGLMDGKRLYIVGGLAGSGSGVSFLGARHVIRKILGKEGVDYYPEKYFSPTRFTKNQS